MTPPDTTHCLEAAHPVFEGHFPGDPLLPGAYLLALVVDDAHDWLALHAPGWRASGVRAVKFTQPIRPGQAFRCVFRDAAGDALRFTVTGPTDRTHATGVIEIGRCDGDDATPPGPGAAGAVPGPRTDSRDA